METQNQLIKFGEEKEKGNITHLIPVHINKARCDNYFWNWSSNHGDWIRGAKIPETLKKAYKNPPAKGCYN